MTEAGGSDAERPRAVPSHSRRHLLRLTLVWGRREFRARYRQSHLDVVWSLVTPVAILGSYGLVFATALDVDGDGIPYLSFAWLGIVMWTFFAQSVATSSGTFVAAADLVTKAAFPRAALPLGTVLAGALDLLIGTAVLAVLMVVQGILPTPAAVWTVLPVALLLLWTMTAALLVAVATAHVRDVGHATGILLRVGFILSPVVYPISALPAALAWTATWSPVAVAIEAARSALLRGEAPDVPLLAVHLVVGAVGLLSALLVVRRLEPGLADVV